MPTVRPFLIAFLRDERHLAIGGDGLDQFVAAGATALV
jgi:hypothetical protein